MLSPIEAKQEKDTLSDADKIDKAVVLYIHVQGVNYRCDECIFYKEEKCALYGPSVPIKPYGGCNLWVHKEKDEPIPWISELDKKQTGYMENEPGFSCKRCEEFLPGEKNCKKVNRKSVGDDPRHIDRDGCCNRWEKK